jgi:hypothetical protein
MKDQTLNSVQHSYYALGVAHLFLSGECFVLNFAMTVKDRYNIASSSMILRRISDLVLSIDTLCNDVF